ncbi:MAG: DUF4190 domain-containing protein [Akkermansiaceae bacterium]|nr:DUF4190 domain-containing protein [Akkermansiaceae bacterium]
MNSNLTPPQRSAAAVASLLLGILGVVALWLSSIPAIICGHLALSRIRKSGGQLGGRRFAIAGLILGYVMTIAALLLAVLIIVFIVNPPVILAPLEGKSVEKWNAERFVDRAGLVLPPSARIVEHQRVFSMDGQEFLRLEMPVGDLDAFLTKSGLDGELTNTTRPGSATSYLGDFLPAHPKKFREGQKALPGGDYLNVLVDEDAAATVTVYLSWFGT